MANQTTTLIRATKTKTAGKRATFPEFPPRNDMQNFRYIHTKAITPALAAHFGSPETTLVASEYPLGPNVSAQEGIRIPDLMVAFECDVALVEEVHGYSIDAHPKAPEFVLEVASRTTGVIDYTAKRRDYARFGVREYWRFDGSGGRFHDAALAGDKLVAPGLYESIPVEWLDANRCRGYSDALGLYLCWENQTLRFYDPDTGRYLRTYEDSESERVAERAARVVEQAARADAEARANAEAERAAEQAARADSESERAAEQAARADAEAARADEAQARAAEQAARADAEADARRQLEAELRQLRQQPRNPDAPE